MRQANARAWPFAALAAALLTLWCWGVTRPFDSYRDASSLNQHRWAVNLKKLGLESKGAPTVEDRPASWTKYIDFKYQKSDFFTRDRHRNRIYMLHYPPMLTIGIAALYSVFGEETWSSRILPLVFTLLGLISLMGLVNRYSDQRTALMTGFFFGLTPVVVSFSQHVDYVPMVTGLSLLAISRWWWWVEAPVKRNYWLFQAAWFLCFWASWHGAFVGILPILHELRKGKGWFLRIVLHGAAPAAFLVLFLFWLSRVGGGAGLDDLASLLGRRTVKNAIEVGDQRLPIPWHLWVFLTLGRPFILFSPLMAFPAWLGLRWLWRHKRKWRRDFPEIIAGKERLVCAGLWIWGLLPVFAFRQVAFVHGYTFIFLSPAMAWTLAILIRDKPLKWRAPAMALFVLCAAPMIWQLNHYLRSNFVKRVGDTVLRNTPKNAVLLTDTYEEVVWSWVQYYTDIPVLYNVDSPAKLKKALAAAPPGHRPYFLTVPLPSPFSRQQGELWTQLRSRHPFRRDTGYFMFDLGKTIAGCRLKPGQEPVIVWDHKLAVYDVKTRLGRDQEGAYLDYTLRMNVKRPLMTDLALLVSIPEINKQDHHYPVDGLMRTTGWPGGRRCVEESRRVRLGKGPLPREISLAVSWCDAVRGLCLREGENLLPKRGLSWTVLATEQTPPPHLSAREAARLTSNMENEYGRLALQMSLPFVEAFALDPSLDWTIESEFHRLAGRHQESYALKSKSLNRYHLMMFIELMIPYAISGHMQSMAFLAMGEAAEQGNYPGALRHGAGLAFYLIPSYEVVTGMAKGVCNQNIKVMCTRLLEKAVRIKPGAATEVGFYAQSIGLKTLAAKLIKDAPPGVGRDAAELLRLKDGRITPLNDFTAQLSAEGRLEPALALVRDRLGVRQVLQLYERLGPLIGEEQLKRDYWFFLDTNDPTAAQAVLNFAEQNL